MSNVRPTRRWLRFSLRAMLLAMLAVAVLLGWRANQVSAQRRVVAALQKSSNNQIHFKLWGPAWLHAILGQDFFADVDEVDLAADWVPIDGSSGFAYVSVTDDDLALVASLPRVRSVKIASPFITDEGLRRLASARNITQLKVVGGRGLGAGIRITEEGIAHLAQLSNLRRLHLECDAGMKVFTKFPSLTHLWIEVPTLADEGVDPLLALENLEALVVMTEAGPFPDLGRFKAVARARLPWFFLSTGLGDVREAWGPENVSINQLPWW